MRYPASIMLAASTLFLAACGTETPPDDVVCELVIQDASRELAKARNENVKIEITECIFGDWEGVTASSWRTEAYVNLKINGEAKRGNDMLVTVSRKENGWVLDSAKKVR